MVEGGGEGPGFELDLGPRGVVVCYTAAVTMEGIRAAVQALGEHPGFRPDLPTVWDFSQAASSSQLDSDDMRRLARDVAPLREGGGRPRVAIVTRDDANFAGARMFSGLNETRVDVQLGVFRDRDRALAWAFDGEAEPETDSPTAG